MKSVGKRTLLHFLTFSHVGYVPLFSSATMYLLYLLFSNRVCVLLRIAWQCGSPPVASFLAKLSERNEKERDRENKRWTFFDISRYNAIVSHATWPFCSLPRDCGRLLDWREINREITHRANIFSHNDITWDIPLRNCFFVQNEIRRRNVRAFSFKEVISIKSLDISECLFIVWIIRKMNINLWSYIINLIKNEIANSVEFRAS